MDLVSTGLKIFGAVKGGKEDKKASAREAAARRKQAAARRAEGQHEAEEEQRQARHIYSRALATAAASGGGTANITVGKILGDIDAEGDYRALMRRYSSEVEARSIEQGAANVEASGRAARTAGYIQGATTLFSEGPDLWKKYKSKI